MVPADIFDFDAEQKWRATILNYVLRFLAVVSSFLLLAGVWLAISRAYYAMLLIAAASLFFALLLLFGIKVNYVTRARLFIVLSFALGGTSFLARGFNGAALYWIYSVPLLASLMIGRKAGSWALLANGLLLLTAWNLSATNVLSIPGTEHFSAVIWTTFIGSFVMLNFVVAQPLGIMLEGLFSSIELARESDRLVEAGETRYRALVDGMLNGVVYYELILGEDGQPVDLRFLEINQAYTEMTGLKASEVEGKLITEIFPGFLEDYSDLVKIFADVALNGVANRSEVYFDPLQSWFAISAYRLRQRFFVVVIDNITEKKKAEGEIESLSRFPRENPNPVVRVGNDFVIQFVNEASRDLLDYWKLDVGQRLHERWIGLLRDALASEEVSEIEGRTEDRVFSFSVASVPGEDYFNLYGLDITKRVQAEGKLRESEQNAQNRLSRLRGLRSIDMAIIGSLNVDSVLRSLLNETLALLDVDAAAVLLSEDEGWLKYRAGRGFRTKKIEASQVHIGEGIAGASAQDRELHWVEDARSSNAGYTRQDLLTAEGFISFYAAPLVAKGKLLGVLEAYKRENDELDEEGRDFLVAIAGQASIAIENAQLFSDLAISKKELEITYDRTLEGWVTALDLRDHETSGHTRRVAELTQILAKALKVPEEELPDYWRGALLHDVGKMAIPDHVLLKPGPLNEEEWEIMRQHPTLAYEWLKDLGYLEKAIAIPYCHHEKWDGSGYPQQIKGEDIPLAARIFAVVDVYDALKSERPYRKAWPQRKVQDYIRSEAGTHFDPDIAQAFLSLNLRTLGKK